MPDNTLLLRERGSIIDHVAWRRRCSCSLSASGTCSSASGPAAEPRRSRPTFARSPSDRLHLPWNRPAVQRLQQFNDLSIMWRKSRLSSNSKTCSTEAKNEHDESEKTTFTKHEPNQGNFERLCGFKFDDLSSFQKFTSLLYRPTNSASLGIVRALFGLCMVLDVVEERGLADIDIKWGDPMECHFPLIHGMKPFPLPWMILIYTIMWLGAFGIMLGYRFKIASACFVIPYWYIFLLDKAYWNNHTYLYGILATLLWGTEANKYFSLDAIKSNGSNNTVPLWNYFILRFQFFALYFLAGLKKSSREWLSGFAMTNLSRHWVFIPFRLFLTNEQIDFYIVHWFGFIFDLTVGFWMLFEKTRLPAMVFCTAFHLMNSRLFSIGMFPYVCLATMPIFCHSDWPCKLGSSITRFYTIFTRNMNKNKGEKFDKKETKYSYNDSQIFHEDDKKYSHNDVNRQINNVSSIDETEEEDLMDKINFATPHNGVTKTIDIKQSNVTKKQKFVTSLLLFHVFLQFFLPYSHFITKGYNNWVPGMYGYSWDMMVHVYDTVLVVIKVHDNVSNEDLYLDSKAWVQTDRWEKHGDMARQYAFCLRDNLLENRQHMFRDEEHRYFRDRKSKWRRLSSNFSIYIDVWCSLNGRFQQRIFNPDVDLLTVDWHPFKPISFLLPLLSQYNSYRHKLEEIQEHVYSWSNDTDVLFVADFPGMYLENYVTKNFTNVSLTVLEGEATYSNEKQKEPIVISKGSSIPIETGQFHRVKTISAYPACYMYTYNSGNREQSFEEGTMEFEEERGTFPILTEINYKIDDWLRALNHITDAFFNIVCNVPTVRRVQINK